IRMPDLAEAVVIDAQEVQAIEAPVNEPEPVQAPEPQPQLRSIWRWCLLILGGVILTAILSLFLWIARGGPEAVMPVKIEVPTGPSITTENTRIVLRSGFSVVIDTRHFVCDRGVCVSPRRRLCIILPDAEAENV